MNGYALQFECMMCHEESYIYNEYDNIPKNEDGQWVCLHCESNEALYVTIIYEDLTRLNYNSSSLQ